MHQQAEEFYQSWPSRMNAAKARAPEVGKAFGPFFQGLMRESGEGGLGAKDKELIALGIAIALRCESCIYAHVEKCLKAAATPRQVMDAAAVAVMMGGGPAYTYLPVVAEALAHFDAPAPSPAPA
jgi:AhpD family alkylhydroperoxidase